MSFYSTWVDTYVLTVSFGDIFSFHALSPEGLWTLDLSIDALQEKLNCDAYAGTVETYMLRVKNALTYSNENRPVITDLGSNKRIELTISHDKHFHIVHTFELKKMEIPASVHTLLMHQLPPKPVKEVLLPIVETPASIEPPPIEPPKVRETIRMVSIPKPPRGFVFGRKL